MIRTRPEFIPRLDTILAAILLQSACDATWYAWKFLEAMSCGGQGVADV